MAVSMAASTQSFSSGFDAANVVAASTVKTVREFASEMPGSKVNAKQDLEKQRQQAREAASRLNTSAFNKKLEFVVDEDSDDIVVQVVDKDTNEVIKTLPPEELRRINNGLRGQDPDGLLFNRSA
jgi:flagellar protein FlaG